MGEFTYIKEGNRYKIVYQPKDDDSTMLISDLMLAVLNIEEDIFEDMLHGYSCSFTHTYRTMCGNEYTVICSARAAAQQFCRQMNNLMQLGQLNNK